MKLSAIYSLAISICLLSFCNGTSLAKPEATSQPIKTSQTQTPESKAKNDALELATEQNDAAVAALQEYDFKAAGTLLKAALKERTAQLGENNPCTILSMNNLACFWYSEIVQGEQDPETKGADALYTKVANLRRQPAFRKLPKECGFMLSRYKACGIDDPADFDIFYQDLQAALKKQDRKLVASLFEYPMNNMRVATKTFNIKSPAEYVLKYNLVMPEYARQAILNSPVANLGWKDKGIFAGDGVVWFDGKTIQAINYHPPPKSYISSRASCAIGSAPYIYVDLL